MTIKTIIFISTICMSALASNSVPFKVKTRTVLTRNEQSEMLKCAGRDSELEVTTIATVKEEEKVVMIDSGKVVKAIEEVRAGICSVIKEGHIRMWFSVTAEGKFLVAETSAEGGLEVQFECKKI